MATLTAAMLDWSPLGVSDLESSADQKNKNKEKLILLALTRYI